MMKHNLIVRVGGECRVIEFEGTPVLGDALAGAGIARQHPCGGRGACGKCAVLALTGAVSAPNAAETRFGARLTCQAVLLGDAEVTLAGGREMAQIELGGAEVTLTGGREMAQIELGGVEVALPDAREMSQIGSGGAEKAAFNPMPGKIGAAIDIGTTTIALRLFDLGAGASPGARGMLNPQTQIAADVMGRIGAAMNGAGDALKSQIVGAMESLLGNVRADALVVTGNTTMLYLLTGRDPAPLSHAPFEADCLFDLDVNLLGARAYLPPCMNAFVGADIACAVLASGMCRRNETALLCDIGTNGEIALWKDGILYVCSTAAGPAFEGVGISCGCGSVPGAIDRVWVENGAIRAHTIRGERAVGVCGSGLIDAAAALLEIGMIDETGATESERLTLCADIALLPADIRAVQLAKAAIAAGIETLTQAAKTAPAEIQTLYIAGGFGSHLNVESAARIGLIPEALKSRVRVIGNAALSGAGMLLLDRGRIAEIRRIAASARHIALGGNPRFNANFIEQMLFPEE